MGADYNGPHRFAHSWRLNGMALSGQFFCGTFHFYELANHSQYRYTFGQSWLVDFFTMRG
ncbi:hypothetical protein U8326_15235 [Tsuneonella sp. CC-YZS046]|uniref:hypothetical protein n=1 Tax=Tsuneonella sp. CC-YZS046 TaxID=3042152 RepID=UPI002D79EC1D|nr:hypothetical protein [Tsuneonella sp. CC-YZS046]WRO66370.1 hypothetical protein U8326_15235 [Tsuneonella sp. CC-YZS046]